MYSQSNTSRSKRERAEGKGKDEGKGNPRGKRSVHKDMINGLKVIAKMGINMNNRNPRIKKL